MRKYQLSVDGDLISVYSCEDAKILREWVPLDMGEGEIAVLLYPVDDADFGALSFDKNNAEPREPQLVVVALSWFFRNVRGYPKMNIDVRINGVMHELNLDYSRLKYSDNIGKCKILCTKTVKFADEIELNIKIVRSENTFATVVCHDAETFNEGRLRLLLSKLFDDGVDAAIAVSMTDRLTARCVGKFSFSDALSVSIAALIAEGIKCKDGAFPCELNRRKVFLICNGGNVTHHPEIKYLY